MRVARFDRYDAIGLSDMIDLDEDEYTAAALLGRDRGDPADALDRVADRNRPVESHRAAGPHTAWQPDFRYELSMIVYLRGVSIGSQPLRAFPRNAEAEVDALRHHPGFDLRKIEGAQPS